MLRTRDEAGNDLNAPGLDVRFSLTGPSTATIQPTADLGNGTYTARLTGARHRYK